MEGRTPRNGDRELENLPSHLTQHRLSKPRAGNALPSDTAAPRPATGPLQSTRARSQPWGEHPGRLQRAGR